MRYRNELFGVLTGLMLSGAPAIAEQWMPVKAMLASGGEERRERERDREEREREREEREYQRRAYEKELYQKELYEKEQDQRRRLLELEEQNRAQRAAQTGH